MDGYGTYYSFRGSIRKITGWLEAQMNLLVIRTGWNF